MHCKDTKQIFPEMTLRGHAVSLLEIHKYEHLCSVNAKSAKSPDLLVTYGESNPSVI
jgi:hypothetical protein